MKIVILDGHAVNPGDLSWDPIRKFGEVKIYEDTKPHEVISHIGDAQIVLVNKAPITEEVLVSCPEIRLICVLATGYNTIACEEAARRGIPVCNVPDYGTAAVAQFTIGLLLELCHQIGHHSDTVHNGKWEQCMGFCYWDTPQIELAGKTIGILGFGKIGRTVGKIAGALGMRVIACNPSRYPEGEKIGEYVDWETLLKESDVLSLHCPLKPENREIISKTAIEKMKDGAILLNTARGGLLCEKDVAEALKSGKLAGAAMDVVSREPIRKDNPLLSAPNCILTPHMAWAPLEARKRILCTAVETIEGFLHGKAPNRVN